MVSDAIKTPKEKRSDIDHKYRIMTGQGITFVCVKCGHYEQNRYLGIDIADIVGEDYSLDEHYNIVCSACQSIFNIPILMDLGLLSLENITLEEMRKNKSIPREMRKTLGNKLEA